jgi:hypothetical protein
LPRATEGALDADDGRQQDVDLASLDFLDGADVQVNEFGKPLLCDALGSALTADIYAELSELRLDFTIRRHAPLGR